MNRDEPAAARIVAPATQSQPALDALVHVDRCTKTYRRGRETVVALADVNLTLYVGELVALVGPSGSGKTTLLNVLIGWESPDHGRVEWPGRSGPPDTRAWHEVSVVPQRLGLLEELTVGENVSLPLRLASPLHVRPPTVDIDALMTELGLRHLASRLPDEVSVGEQQRAAIARALVLAPPLVVCDEPTGHQDEHNARLALAAMRSVRDRGGCCLVATHAEEVLRVADRVVAIQDGRIIQDRTSGPAR